MAPISTADAPPSSPEFVIKKPHDETNRAKQWRARAHGAPPPRMPTLSEAVPGGNRRITRTYSKRDAVTSSYPARAAREPPLKRRKIENPSTMSAASEQPTTGPPTAPRPAASLSSPSESLAGMKEVVGKGEKARKTTIHAYFSSVPKTSSPPLRMHSAAVPSSPDRQDSKSDGAVSPPSSPRPVSRRWTSPRRLKPRSSLAPIAGVEGEATDGGAATEAPSRRKTSSSGTRTKGRRHILGNVLGAETDGGNTVKAAPPAASKQQYDEQSETPATARPAAMCRDLGLKSCAVEIPDSEKESLTLSPPDIKHHTPTERLRERRPSASRAYASPPVSNPTTREDTPNPSLPHSADPSIPVYNMPYAFYLAAAAAAKPPSPAQSRSSSPSPATSPGAAPASSKAARKPSGGAGRKVQTTLNLSTKQAFKECRLCDTVYNPLHPADVKLHQARHARILGGGGVGTGKRKTVS